MNNADAFRRSVEASLPPLVHYGSNVQAPGLYGAYGWGVVNYGGGGGGQDSLRASLPSGQHDAVGQSGGLYPHDAGVGAASGSYPEVRLRPEQYHSPARQVREGALWSNAVAEAAAQMPAAPKQQSTGEEAQPPVHGGMDATCVVQQVLSPGRSLYPRIPGAATLDDSGQGRRAVPQLRNAGASRNVALPSSQAGPRGPASQPEPGVQFAEQVTYHRYQHHQQPYMPHQPQAPNAQGITQTSGKVVHMRRSEAWTKYIAYEGCLQVCINELGQENSQYFLGQAFSVLRGDFGIDDLLLTQVSSLPAGVEAANDICWDDLEPPDKRLNVNTVAYANTTSTTSYIKVRCQRLTLPSTGMLQKLCCRQKTTFVLPNLQGVMVYLTPCDPEVPSTGFMLDGRGTALQQGQAAVLSPEAQSQQGADLAVHVEGSDGSSMAAGTISYSQVWRLGLKGEAIDEALDHSSHGTVFDVQVFGVGPHAGKAAIVTLSVVRLRKEVSNYELAQVVPEHGLGAGTLESVNKNSLRTNACLAYDTALGAALKADGCCRSKLLVRGPWEWLLAQFALYFGVRTYYCLLAHLRWVLKPGVASISTMCLDVIGEEFKPLLEQAVMRGLTTHESTLLEGVKKAVEQLLEVAFENYYALGDDTSRPAAGGDTPRGGTGGPDITWHPTVLMAAFRLFRSMRDVFLPTDQDWLNTRFRVAAKKRWHFLEANCGYEQMQQFGHNGHGGGGIQRGNQPAPRLGVNTNTHDSYYKMAERMSMAIRSDLEFDIFLQRQPDLLPSSLNLPRITAEEYMANFVEILRNMLDQCPPLVPSVAAVDLLVATAQLQRYLQDTTLYMPRQHPGHLDAMELWRPHVLFWIDNSRRGLCGHCGELEAEAKLTAAHLARVDVTKIAPGMIDSIEGAVAPLVRDMLDRTWAELMLYERVVKNWPLFGPHLEAALCDVLRTVNGSLNRVCTDASNVIMGAQGGGGGVGPAGGSAGPSHSPLQQQHRRVASAMPGHGHGMGPGGSPGGPGGALHPGHPHHQRGASHMPGSYMAGPHGGGQRGSPAVPMVPQGMSPGPGPGAAGGAPGGRNAVLLKEAVLLNSLKVLMVMVPSIEDIISKWCGGQSMAPPGGPHPGQPDPAFEDELAPHIGAQFAQVVKELRTDYAEGVAACSNRMADFIRATPVTNIKAALGQPKPPADHHHAMHQVSTLTAQREFVESFMRPILAACDDALQALRAALDPRVFVATGRALWDCMGKDLFEFVHFLQESVDNRGAWRVRQHANVALTHLCDFFRARLAASMEHCIGERDLDLPIHVDKAQKLLAQNSAVVNITLNPI